VNRKRRPRKAEAVPSGRRKLRSIEDVADELLVSTKTVRRWIAAKLLPTYRFGRQIRISDADLAAFIMQSRAP
jgi:excisionase family DNA binding protein